MKAGKDLTELAEKINESARAGTTVTVSHIQAIMSAANDDETIMEDLQDLVERHDEFLTADELQERLGEMDDDDDNG